MPDAPFGRIEIENLSFKISPKLSSIIIFDKLEIKDKNNNTAIYIADFKTYIDVKKFSQSIINAGEIKVNLDYLSGISGEKTDKKPTKKSFNLNQIPHINVGRIIITKNKNVKFIADIQNLKTKNIYNKKIINLRANIELDRINDKISLGESGEIYVKNNKLFANNYVIKLGQSEFLIDGEILNKNNLGDFTLKGDKIQVDKTMQTLLFLQKFTDPTKKFIENFKDFKGLMFLDIVHKDNDFQGVLRAENLKAKTVLFNVPLEVKETEFILKNNEITSFTTGRIGSEIITHKLLVKNLTSKDKEVFGEVKSKITDKLVKQYLPKEYKMQNYADVKIDYYIKNKKITVKYYANLPKTTNIYFNNFYSGITNKEKRIYAETYKDNDYMYLKNYKYSIKENSQFKDILTGEGLFIRKNNKMNPQYITCKTNGFVPNSVTGSFGNYVTGGEFNGLLKYNFLKNQITGNFEVINTIFNIFFVKSAKVNANEKVMDISAYGTYRKEKFTCNGSVKNNFKEKIYVTNMDLFLDKYKIKRNRAKAKTSKKFDFKNPNKEFSAKVREINMDIDKWQIKGNIVQVDNIEVKDIVLNGSLKDSVFKYNIAQIFFANGIISAKGTYNFNDDSSIIDFNAKDIDSNIIATKIFNLPNQVQGLATATLHSQTSKNWKNWKANATFEINNGALPQFENIEFAVVNGEKAKVSDFIKTTATKNGDVNSKIQGSFKCDDTKIYDVDLKLQHEFVSFFIEGIYNYINGNEDITMYGKYDNNVTQKTKIIHIPANLLINILIPKEKMAKYQTKLDKIPKTGNNANNKFFIINVNGNPYAKDIKFSIKRLKN